MVGSPSSANLYLENGIQAQNAFLLVWFDPSGTSAGYIEDSSFTLPEDGALQDYDTVFLGEDPVLTATGITFVPEPSSTLLSLLGLLPLLRRRR
ncbi:MAG: hypothetical protein QM680_06915 [Luteolibacter sp.]